MSGPGWALLLLGLAYVALCVWDMVAMEHVCRQWREFEPGWTEQQVRDFVVDRFSAGWFEAVRLEPVRRGWLAWWP